MGTSSLKRGLFLSLLIIALLSCCAALVLSSCSQKASTAIVGKWQGPTKESVEFCKDGTVITSEGPPGNTRIVKEETGKYTFTDGSHMNLQIHVDDDTNHLDFLFSCEVHIQGDKMNMTMTVPGQSQQRKENFKRLK